MSKKIFVFIVLLLFGVLFSSHAYAIDVSIDRVRMNGEALAEDETNLIEENDEFDVTVSLTAIEDLSNIHVEAILTGLKTGNTVSDTTGTFILNENQSTLVALNLQLINSLEDETDFDLDVKVVDINGNEETKSYGVRLTDRKAVTGALDVSIDRVRVNGVVVSESRTNFIEESDDFDVLVEFTTLEDLEDAHVEAILKDLISGTVVADASPNFDLDDDVSSSILLSLELIDQLKKSNSFELTIRIVDAEGNDIEQLYKLKMRDGDGVAGRVLDISIDSVEVESKIIAENENNFVVIGESKKEIDLRIRMTSLETVEDARVEAILTFENGDVVADKTTTFDINEDENIVKKLALPLIGKFEQNSFKLKVKVVDAEGDVEEKLYGLKINAQKFPFVISSIALSPESNAEAGKALVARLSFKNSGVLPLEGITAKVSITELGIFATKFIDQIKNSKLSEVREDFVLKILDNVPTGTYTLRSEIGSQFGGDNEVKEIPVFIVGKSEQKLEIVNDKLVINIPLLKQNIKNDGSEVIYQLKLTNEGPDANTYTLLLDGANWANLRLAESNTFVINPKDSKTINIYASTRADVVGEQIFVVTIKSSDKVLKQMPFKGNIVSVAGKGLLAAKLKNALEVILIAFVVFLVAIGFFFGFKKYISKSKESEEQEELEAYY